MLKVSNTVASLISDGHSVLVQNAFGINIVAVVMSLSQVLLDSYYRTYEGIQVSLPTLVKIVVAKQGLDAH